MSRSNTNCYSLNPELLEYRQGIAEAMKSLKSSELYLVIHQSLNQ